METLCDHIDGALSLLGNLAVFLIQYSIKSDNLEDLDTKYPVLKEFSQSVFMHTPAEIRVETCLLVISILSYLLPKRADLIITLEQCIKDNQEFFFFNKNNNSSINYQFQNPIIFYFFKTRFG
jgi:hypothetical protein